MTAVEATRSERGWRRAAGLLVLALALSVSSVTTLVAVPLLVLAMVRGPWWLALAGVLMVTPAAMMAAGGTPLPAIWYLEHGWAVILGGWFLAITLRWPSARFFPRALASVLGAATVVGIYLVVQPGVWTRIDWMVSQRIVEVVDLALGAARVLSGPDAELPRALVTTFYQAAEQQGRVFPALLGLSSLAALGVAWWCYVRLGHGSDKGLGPLREFRFNDHLVWLFIGGLLLALLGGSEAGDRAGSNALIFMGGLYALRGAAVVAFFNAGMSVLWVPVLMGALVLLGPFLVMGAVIIGVGDTWLDLRSRAEALAGNDQARGG